jgi:hypothetical protein
MQIIPGVSCFMLENYCMKATLLPGSELGFGGSATSTPYNPRYPLTNLLQEQRSERWRTPEGLVIGGTWAQFDMGKAVKPNTFAVIDCRTVFDSATVIASDTPDFSITTDFQFGFGANYLSPGGAGSAVVEPMSRVQLWHNDENDRYGDPFTAKRYWMVFFPWPSGGGYNYIECGIIWMGRRFEVPIDTRFRIAGEGHSTVSTLDSGAVYYDRRPRSRSVACVTTSKETKDIQALRNAVETAAPGSPVLCDIYAFGASTTGFQNVQIPPFVSEGRFYGYLDARTGWEQRTVKVGRYSFTIDEAIA